MTQEQTQVSKTAAAQAAGRRRTRRTRRGDGGEPESAYWQPDWYTGRQDTRSGDEDE